MPRCLLVTVACLIFATASALVGCGGEDAARQTYDVRGRLVGMAFDGQAVVIDHERIPGYMEAMQMTLRLGEGVTLGEAQPGDVVRFTLAVESGTNMWVEAVDVLPPDTELQLAAPLAPADTAAADTTAAPE